MSENKKLTPIFGRNVPDTPSASSIFEEQTSQTAPSLFGGQATTESVFTKPSTTSTFGASSFGMLNKSQKTSFAEHSSSIFGKRDTKPQPLFGGHNVQGSSKVFTKSPSSTISSVFGKIPMEDPMQIKSQSEPSSRTSNLFAKSLQNLGHTTVQAKSISSSQKTIEDPPVNLAKAVNPEGRPIINMEDPFGEPPSTSPKPPTSLVAMDIPSRFCDKKLLLQHFKKFGKVEKLVVYRSNRKATIHYSNAKNAATAKANGKSIHPNFPEIILLFGTNMTPKKTTKLLKPNKLQVEPVKTLAKKVETKISSPSAKAKPSFAVSDKDSPTLIKSQAFNNLDKYQILEARDKLLRAQKMKVSDVNKARYLAASCPDMCPEKERYMRDIQSDLSSFELTGGLLDHRLAIKKFSRSSADKDEPLPHELRPGPVLRLTMDYLVCHILDDTRATTEVWYNYLWNRTRALRNDIMQQHLVSADAVYVLERCVRFHIHCAHNFCEESADIFDPKMNDEHLFKSLQSLKEAYHDLSERDQYFSSEAEFRSYEILLNLQDGDIIYKFQNLRDCVRNSPNVKFAVQCLHASHSKNYIRFFRLVRKATYLQACILHRYYADVRNKAMSVIIKSYSTFNKSQNIPIHTFKNMLGIITDAELTSFLNLYDLTIEGECVVVEKKFLNTGFQMSVIRDKVTQSKLSTVSKIIHGSNVTPVDPTAAWTPHNSFTARGFLKNDAITGEDQLSTDKEPMQVPPLDMSEDQLERHLLDKMYQMYQFKLLQRAFSHWRAYAASERKVKDLIRRRSLNVCQKAVKKWREFVYNSRAKRQSIQLKLMKRGWNQWVSHTRRKLALRSLREHVAKRMSSIAAIKAFRRWKNYVNTMKMRRKLRGLRLRIQSRKFFHAWRQFMEIKRKSNIAVLFSNRKVLVSTFSAWRRYVKESKESQESDYINFPSATSGFTSKQINGVWSWGYDRQAVENRTAVDLQLLDSKIQDNFSKISVVKVLENGLVRKPLPFLDRFQELIRKPLDKQNFYNSFVKLVLLVDDRVSESFVHWIRNKFCLGENVDIYDPLHVEKILTSETTGSSFSIFIDEYSLSDLVELEMACCVITITTESTLQDTQTLLAEQAYTPNIILCESSQSQCDRDSIWLVSQEDRRSSVLSVDLYNRVVESWLKFISNDTILKAPLYNVMSGFISNNVINPIIAVAQQRQLYSSWSTHPNIFIEFYNDAVIHFFDCLVEKDCSTLERESLVLPPFVLSARPTDEENDISLKRYLKVITKNLLVIPLLSEIQQILTKCKSKQFPWLDIFDVIVGYKLSSLSDVSVCVNSERLQSFRPKRDYISFLLSYDDPPSSPPRTSKRKLETKPILPLPEEPLAKKTKLLFQDIQKEKEKMRQMEMTMDELLRKLQAT